MQLCWKSAQADEQAKEQSAWKSKLFWCYRDSAQSSRKGGSHRGSADTTGITSWELNKGKGAWQSQRGNGGQGGTGERRALAAGRRYGRVHHRRGASGEGGGEGCCVKLMGRGPETDKNESTDWNLSKEGSWREQDVKETLSFFFFFWNISCLRQIFLLFQEGSFHPQKENNNCSPKSLCSTEVSQRYHSERREVKQIKWTTLCFLQEWRVVSGVLWALTSSFDNNDCMCNQLKPREFNPGSWIFWTSEREGWRSQLWNGRKPHVLGAFLNGNCAFSVMLSTAQVQLLDYSWELVIMAWLLLWPQSIFAIIVSAVYNLRLCLIPLIKPLVWMN